jgi:uncharacterized protein involved in exopolysaccharide biosynthesis
MTDSPPYPASKPEQPPVTVAAGSSRELSLISVIVVLARRRRLILGIIAATVVCVALITIFRNRTYSADGSFACKSANEGQLASGIAAGLGLALGNTGGMQSPQYYAALVQSRVILGAVADSTYIVPTKDGFKSMTLVQAYRNAGDSPDRARDRAIKHLQDIVSASLSSTTGIITVTVTERTAALASHITRVILDRLNEFNLRERQIQAGNERVFTEQRLTDALAELHVAENNLAAFQTENRDFERSPRLKLESQRLTRIVSTKQQVYTSLSQDYEQARLNELRDTPLIITIDVPHPPSLPDPRGLMRNVILAFLVSAAFGVLIAVLAEYVDVIRNTESAELRELATVWRGGSHSGIASRQTP